MREILPEEDCETMEREKGLWERIPVAMATEKQKIKSEMIDGCAPQNL